MVLPPIVVGILWRVMYAVDISPFHRFMAFIGLPVPSLITDPDYGADGDRASPRPGNGFPSRC